MPPASDRPQLLPTTPEFAHELKLRHCSACLEGSRSAKWQDSLAARTR